MAGAWDGIKVSDLTLASVGCLCTSMLRDPGAEIIKVKGQSKTAVKGRDIAGATAQLADNGVI